MTRNLYGSIARLKDFPIDETTRFPTYDSAMRYCLNNATAYIGQILSIYDDNKKAQGGEDKNGIYIIIYSEETQTHKTLLRATDSDAIDRLTQGLNNLSSDLDALEGKLGEDIENKLKSFATQAELDEVNQKVEELIGLHDGDTIDETLDTIKEISDWIVSHEDFVRTIVDVNTRVALLKTQQELLATNLENTSNTVSMLVNEINQIRDANYITTANANILVQNSSYGFRKLSFSNLSSQKFSLPTTTKLVIDKINIFLESGAEDAHFRIYVKDPLTQLVTTYISDDDEDPLTGNFATSYFDTEMLGQSLYNLSAEINKNAEVWYEISYDANHNPANNLKGTIGVSFYNIF